MSLRKTDVDWGFKKSRSIHQEVFPEILFLPKIIEMLFGLSIILHESRSLLRKCPHRFLGA